MNPGVTEDRPCFGKGANPLEPARRDVGGSIKPQQREPSAQIGLRRPSVRRIPEGRPPTAVDGLLAAARRHLAFAAISRGFHSATLGAVE